MFTSSQDYILCLGLPHPTIAHFSYCQCGCTIDDLGIHLFWCLCKNVHIATHDTFWDIVTTIILESGAHIQKEVSHLFPYHTWWRINIFINIRDGFRTLTDIIIVDLTYLDMIQCASSMIVHVVIIVTQEKTHSYLKHT
jgi:hypothetical protein